MTFIDIYGEIILVKCYQYIILLCVLFLVSACGDYNKIIIKDYYLSKTNYYNIAIIKNEEYIVFPNVTMLNCNNEFIYGMRETSKQPDYLLDGTNIIDDKYFGFFIIRISDGSVSYVSKIKLEHLINPSFTLIPSDEFNECR